MNIFYGSVEELPSAAQIKEILSSMEEVTLYLPVLSYEDARVISIKLQTELTYAYRVRYNNDAKSTHISIGTVVKYNEFLANADLIVTAINQFETIATELVIRLSEKLGYSVFGEA